MKGLTPTIRSDRLYLIFSFVYGAFLSMIMVVSMIYQVEMAQLTPLQLVLVGTALELSVLLFEIPTGVVADVYSRKLSIVVGFIITGIAFTLGGSFPVFGVIAFSSFLWGIGATFLSGAKEAWITDEVGELRAGVLILRGSRYSYWGSFLGILAAVMLGNVQINLPYVLGGVLITCLGIFVLFTMSESGFKPADREDRRSWQRLGSVFRDGVRLVRSNRTLITILLIGLVIGAFSEGYDRLSTAHLLRNFTFPEVYNLQPVVWFGVMRAISSILSIILTRLAEERVDTNSHRAIASVLSVVTAMILAAVVMFALVDFLFAALILYILIGPLRSVTGPLTVAWLNQNIDSNVRATVISMHGQSDALGQTAGGPGVGLVGQLISIPVAITVSGILLSPAVYLYRRSIDAKD